MNAANRPANSASRLPHLRSSVGFLGVFASLLLLLASPVAGGVCWATMKSNGRCTNLLGEKMSKEECCASQGAAAWSPDDYDSGVMFFYQVLDNGTPCQGCRDSCRGMQCGSGKRCQIRQGRPRCVCAPQCGAAAGALRPGPVCGTDGRSYRSLCRLRKRVCRRRTRDLALDYYGHCQNSCAKVRCGPGRHCLVDQDQRPHCVRCTHSCSRAHLSNPGFDSHDNRVICGSDGRTYHSACHLRMAACRSGRSIPMAYRGPCNANASCSTIKCKPRQACLSEPHTGAPRCVTCGSKCPRSPRPRRALCASNNHTYASWCHMLRDACATGFVIDTRHAGPCGTVNLGNSNTVHHDNGRDDDDLDIST